MHRTPFLVSVAVGLVCVASVGVLSCSDTRGQTSVSAAGPQQSAASHDPHDTAHLVERSRARMELVVEAQHDSSKWIEVYAYETPELKRNVPLSSYLQGKDQFHYDQPSPPQVLLIEENESGAYSHTAYVEVNYLWLAYKHWKIGQEDPNKTELLEALEIWHFSDGEWFFQSPPERRGEYFEKHPNLLRKAREWAAARGTASAGEGQ